jgi:hypothetical protein
MYATGSSFSNVATGANSTTAARNWPDLVQILSHSNKAKKHMTAALSAKPK